MQTNLTFPGICDLLDIPVLCWALLQEEGEQSEQQQQWRLLLCSIHMQSPRIPGSFFIHIIYFSLLWRSFLILHGQGFIRNGQLNLKLFSQLYWLITLSFLVLAISLDQPMYLKGQFPQGSVRGTICLLTPIDNEPHKKNLVLVYGINLIYGFISTVYVFYLAFRCIRFTKTMCPGKKMSCIGKYKRNVLSYGDTVALSVAWNTNTMLFPVFMEFLEHLHISPKAVFLVDTFYYVFTYEIVTLLIVFTLSNRDFPVHSAPPKISQFYVHSPPNLLEPRRPPRPQSCLPQPQSCLPLVPVPIPTITHVAAWGKGKGKNRSGDQQNTDTIPPVQL